MRWDFVTSWRKKREAERKKRHDYWMRRLVDAKNWNEELNLGAGDENLFNKCIEEMERDHKMTDAERSLVLLDVEVRIDAREFTSINIGTPPVATNFSIAPGVDGSILIGNGASAGKNAIAIGADVHANDGEIIVDNVNIRALQRQVRLLAVAVVCTSLGLVLQWILD